MRLPTIGGAATSAALVLGLLLASPVDLEAHARLKSSSPASGAHLGAVPRELRLDFTESPALGFVRLTLRGPAGDTVRLGAVGYAADSRRAIIAAVPGIARAGAYTVEWQVAGDDGHPIRGTYSFVIAPGASGLGTQQPVSASRDSAMAAMHHDPVTMPSGGEFDVENPAYVLTRWLQFAGLLALVGIVAFSQVVLRLMARRSTVYAGFVESARGSAARLGVIAACVVLVAAVARLLAQSAAMHGGSRMLDGALIAAMLGATTWGYAWMVQVAGATVAACSLWMASRAPWRGGAWALAIVSILVLAFTPAFSGHAASAPRMSALAIIADGLHVTGAGGWLGSLLLVILVGIPTALALGGEVRGPAVADLINAFSPTALAFAGVVGATGLFAGWLHLGSVSAVWQSSYGKTLLVKLAILSVVALTGAYNWLRVKPTLGQPEGAVRIRRSATVEVLVGALVLLVTAILVAMPTAMDMKM